MNSTYKTMGFKNITLLVSMFSGMLFCQEVESEISDDNSYIEKMRDYIAIENSINNDYERFKVSTTGGNYEISPNIRTNYRIQLNYKFILAGFQFAPSFFPNNGDDESKGETKSINFKLKFVLDHWYSVLEYQTIKGFYLSNSDEFNTNNEFITFPDLHFKSYAFETAYVQNKNFSLRSLTNHMERQIRSTGSFIPVLKMRYFIMDDTSESFSTQKSNNFEISIGPGYAYNFVLNKKFYASVGALMSVGNINTKLTTRFNHEDYITYQNNFLLQWEGKIGIGFNGTRIYSGVYTTISETNYRQEHTTATNLERQVFYNLFLGYRFSSPKKIANKVKSIEDSLHL